jgi:hypothetical protein
MPAPTTTTSKERALTAHPLEDRNVLAGNGNGTFLSGVVTNELLQVHIAFIIHVFVNADA